MIKSDIISNSEADALLEVLAVWERRHRYMANAQRCTPDPFGDIGCVDDLYSLACMRRTVRQ